jgi:formylglycine-generating enzyme required for sulfatase activity
VAGYEVLSELGRGGMSVVYLARQIQPGRLVALKMLLAGVHASSERRARFLAEADAIARLQHPNIVAVHEVGFHDDVPFFSMELVEGGTLHAKLARTPQQPHQAAALVETLARAVHYAHERGVVHRDLKPGNVLLAFSRAAQRSATGPLPFGSRLNEFDPKIADFGLARLQPAEPANGPDDHAGLTTSGAVLGTPSYMAPEQAAGHSRAVGRPADVYALGVILYECLIGRPPFWAANAYDTLAQVIAREPVPPRQLNRTVPRDLETVCLKCLRKEPARRYATAGELADDLQRFLQGQPITARPVSLFERAVKWAKNRPAVAALWAVGVLAAAGLLLGGLWYRAARRQARAEALVQSLAVADTLAVPRILEDLAEYRDLAQPRLREMLQESAHGSRQQLHLALALLPSDKGQVAVLQQRLLDASAAEVLVIRGALRAHTEQLTPQLWKIALDDSRKRAQRVRAAGVLADFDAHSPHWQHMAVDVANHLVEENPAFLEQWLNAFRPVRVKLLGPLGRVFRDKDKQAERLLAASIMADYAADQPKTLVELIVEADARQFVMLFPKLKPHKKLVVEWLQQEVDRQAAPNAPEAAREALARRQAGAALALVRLGEMERFWQVLKHREYPEARTRLIQRLGPNGVSVEALAARLKTEKNNSIRSALILALGEYRDQEVPQTIRKLLAEKLLEWYRDDPDAGLHGAIDWLLGHDKEGEEERPLKWGQAKVLQQINDDQAARTRAGRVAAVAGQVAMRSGGGMPLLAVLAPSWTLLHEAGVNRGWYVNGQGQTLTVVDSRQPFLMGSPPDSEKGQHPDETMHWRHIDRRYAIATKPVTVRQFEQFLKANSGVKYDRSALKPFSPVPDGPIVYVTWYEAVHYCNWLSEQEGIPCEQWCYLPNEKGQYAEGMKAAPGYLKRRGYRLPTEAEWEFACRAGARTSRYYGSSTELLPRYSWYLGNSPDRTRPVGQKRPNDYGLFDMHGNAWNWCQSNKSHGPHGAYPRGTRNRPVKDNEDKGEVTDKDPRVFRAASFAYPSVMLRSAYRDSLEPAKRGATTGFRVARTCD